MDNNNIFLRRLMAGVLVLAGLAIFATQFFDIDIKRKGQTTFEKSEKEEVAVEESDKQISALPSEIELPVEWGDLGAKMASVGVIDVKKWNEMYKERGGLTEEQAKMISQSVGGKMKMTKENANYLLNLFWALGVGNKNEILEKGEMANPQYGGAGNFASTGGWPLSTGDTMDHYSRHPFIVLTKEQQELLYRVSKNIYRPCCGNSTHFPDCNHGMAMLGLLELMAVQGASEQQMYKTALDVNSFWFPSNYAVIEQYFGKRGVEWKDVDAKTVLGSAYSSGSGYQKIVTEVIPPKTNNKGSGGGSCGA